MAWLLVTLLVTGLLTYRWRSADKRAFLPGRTTSGHYQIELDCRACHTPWMGVKEDACYNCHGEEMKAANDSHPKSKFTDPRNADRLNLVKADNCVTCHREHLPDQTHAMGVTMPDDYCYHCHQQTLTDRPSHKDFPFNSCATAGCHNYHDNTALYEDFLSKHAHEPQTKSPAVQPPRNLLAFLVSSGQRKQAAPLTAGQQNAPAEIKAEDKVAHDWAATAHAKAGVNCADCHMVEDKATHARRWSDKLTHESCANCHREEAGGFLAGKHGMRLARSLTPMLPALARLPMKPEAAHRELSCVSCHGAHEFDTRKAAVEACLSCHDDGHSRAYQQSEHFKLWQDELAGKGRPGSGVSCATCHLPRLESKSDGERVVRVQHNQNDNLRPNEKMIRSVCLDCHGLGFSLDALADSRLVHTNFTGLPASHVDSIEMVLRRQVQLQKPKTTP